MATHSSIFAWEIPQTEECKIVGHDLVIKYSNKIHTICSVKKKILDFQMVTRLVVMIS